MSFTPYKAVNISSMFSFFCFHLEFQIIIIPDEDAGASKHVV